MKLRQVVSLIAGFTVMLVNGSLYIYGALTPYLVTFLRYKGNQTVTVSDLSIILTMTIIFTNVGIYCNNFKILTFSNKMTSLITVIGISASVFVQSFVDNFIGYILIYGIIFGFFIGYGYLASLKNCYEHLPNRKGLCSGACLTGFGLGAFFFNFILLAIVNPDNLKQDQNKLFPREVGERIPEALRILSAIYLCIGLLGVFILNAPPSQKDQSNNPLLQINDEDQLNGNPHYSLQAIKYAYSKKIFYLTLILSMTAPYGMFVAFNYKEYGLIFIKDDKFLSILGSIGSIANGGFRLVWGAMMDYFPFKTNKFIIYCVFLVTCSTIVVSTGSNAAYLIVVVISYGCYGGLYAIYPTITVQMLGKKVGSKLYAYTFIGFSIGAIIQYLCHKYLVQWYGNDGYTCCLIIFGGFILIAMYLTWIIDFQMHGQQIKKSPVNSIKTTIQSNE